MDLTRVLIVDDNEMFLEMAKFVLTAAANVVETAADASEALLKIPFFLPDVILMDIQMPVMDGMALARRLKADPATRHIVIVAFTAYAMKGDEARMRAAGCDGCIAKPIDVASFAAEVRSQLPTCCSDTTSVGAR